jgi:hypothetical protein
VTITIVSAVAALAGVVLGQVLTRNTAKQNWIRDANRKAAVQCLAALEVSRHVVDDMRGANSAEQRDHCYLKWRESMRDIYPAVAEVDLLFPPMVRKALRPTTESLNKYMTAVRKQSNDWRASLDSYHDERRALINNMRAVLDIPRD